MIFSLEPPLSSGISRWCHVWLPCNHLRIWIPCQCWHPKFRFGLLSFRPVWLLKLFYSWLASGSSNLFMLFIYKYPMISLWTNRTGGSVTQNHHPSTGQSQHARPSDAKQKRSWNFDASYCVDAHPKWQPARRETHGLVQKKTTAYLRQKQMKDMWPDGAYG